MLSGAKLPPPGLLLGLKPEESAIYPGWYPNQDQIVDNTLGWLNDPDHKFMCAALPTGTGKSLVAALTATISGMRTAVLTSTKGLQDQFLSDFHRIGFRDIRGQNAYPCILIPDNYTTVETGPCHSGYKCEHRNNGCIYYNELRNAINSKLLLTNYAYWLTQSRSSSARGLGPVDFIVMDEADDAFNAIESYLSMHMSLAECRLVDVKLPDRHSHPGTWYDWQEWAHENIGKAQKRERELRYKIQDKAIKSIATEDLSLHRRIQDLTRKLEMMVSSLGTWVWKVTGGGRSGGGLGFFFTPIWPGEYANLIFGSARKVLIMSATLTPKTIDLLNINTEDRVWIEAGSVFHPGRTPTQHIKTVRVDHRTTDIDMRTWVNRIDQIVDRRMDRKGILFPVSYDRADFFYRNTRHRRNAIVHGPGEIVQAVDKWRNSPAPSLLISPSVTRGWDFPGDECRYIIVGKIPFADSRDPVVKARQKEDPDFNGYEAMQKIVQESGRGTRSPDDWCESIIVDDNWVWFYKKNYHYAPMFFRERMKPTTYAIPEPPPLLTGPIT